MSDTAARAREQRIAEIREREKKASPDWELRGDSITRNTSGKHPNGIYVATFGCGYTSRPQSEEDAAFAAHARADIPFLLEQLAAQSAAPVEEVAREIVYERSANSDTSANVFVAGVATETKGTTEALTIYAGKLVRLIKDEDVNRAIYMLTNELRQHGYGAQGRGVGPRWITGMPSAAEVKAHESDHPRPDGIRLSRISVSRGQGREFSITQVEADDRSFGDWLCFHNRKPAIEPYASIIHLKEVDGEIMLRQGFTGWQPLAGTFWKDDCDYIQVDKNGLPQFFSPVPSPESATPETVTRIRNADLIIPSKPPLRTPENDVDHPEHKTVCADLQQGKECSHKHKRPWKKA